MCCPDNYNCAVGILLSSSLSNTEFIVGDSLLSDIWGPHNKSLCNYTCNNNKPKKCTLAVQLCETDASPQTKSL